MVAIAVNLLVRIGGDKDTDKILLYAKDRIGRADQLRIKKKLAPIYGAFWSLFPAIYIVVSFLTNRWDMTWVIWPAASMLFVVIDGIAKATMKK